MLYALIQPDNLLLLLLFIFSGNIVHHYNWSSFFTLGEEGNRTTIREAAAIPLVSHVNEQTYGRGHRRLFKSGIVAGHPYGSTSSWI